MEDVEMKKIFASRPTFGPGGNSDSFKAAGKTFSFKRVEVDGVGTLKLIVK